MCVLYIDDTTLCDLRVLLAESVKTYRLLIFLIGIASKPAKETSMLPELTPEVIIQEDSFNYIRILGIEYGFSMTDFWVSIRPSKGLWDKIYKTKRSIDDLIRSGLGGLVTAKEVADKLEEHLDRFTGLAIAANLGQKTLVIVHTVALRNQWEKEVEKVFGISPGIIGSGKFETDAPIVIGNVQTLTRRVPSIINEFGTVILDEMHHVSSPTFNKIIDESKARYKIGLSGTIERKDGKHVIFRDYFSPKVYFPPKENYMVPKIHIFDSEIRFLDGHHTPWAKKVNHLAYNEEYQHFLALLAGKYATKGHRVLVVADRVELLKKCCDLVGDIGIVITGGTPQEDRITLMEEIKKDKKVLFGTQSIFSEGVSINELSCLILGTPVNNEPLLTQLIGRVIRVNEDKKDPIIIDINLKGNTARKQANNRRGYYIKQGYKILDMGKNSS